MIPFTDHKQMILSSGLMLCPHEEDKYCPCKEYILFMYTEQWYSSCCNHIAMCFSSLVASIYFSACRRACDFLLWWPLVGYPSSCYSRFSLTLGKLRSLPLLYLWLIAVSTRQCCGTVPSRCTSMNGFKKRTEEATTHMDTWTESCVHHSALSQSSNTFGPQG
jgi:hypothetical protein